MTEHLRLPPQSIEAEQSVLGGLMLDPGALDKVLHLLGEGDFYRRDHVMIYRAIKALADKGKPYDAVTVGEFFSAKGMSEMVEGGAYLTDLVRLTPSSANIRAYAEIVRDKAMLREMIDAGTSIVADGFQPDGKDVTELLAKAEQSVMALARGRHSNDSMQAGKRGLRRAVAEMERRILAGQSLLGISSSLDALDDMILGLQDSDLVILAARPSMGKTAFMLQMRRHAAKLGKRPLTISMEMTAEQVYMRDIAAVGSVNYKRVQNPILADEQDMQCIQRAFAEMEPWEWWLDDTSSMTVGQICSRIRRAKKDHDIGIAFIDYLQFIDLGEVRNGIPAALQNVTRMLKALAKELRIPIVLLSQLNRGLESRTNKRPMMSDLRESGAIEQDADVVLFLHREAYYNKDWPATDPRQSIGEVIVSKARNGETGTVMVKSVLAYQRFDNLAEHELPMEYETAEKQAANEQRSKRDGKSGAGFQPGGNNGTGRAGKDRGADQD